MASLCLLCFWSTRHQRDNGSEILLAFTASFAFYYALLAAGALTRLEGKSLVPRLGRVGAVMTVTSLVMIAVAVWATMDNENDGLESIPVWFTPMVTAWVVFSGVKALAPTTEVEDFRVSRLGSFLHRFSKGASRVLFPAAIQGLGMLLIFVAPWLGRDSLAESFAALQWITSSSYVSWQWAPAVLVRESAGSAVFGLAFALALFTAWRIGQSLWRRRLPRQSMLAGYFALLSAFLLCYTQLDAFYAILGLHEVASPPTLYAAWLVSTLACLVIIGTAGMHVRRADSQRVLYLVMLGFPVLIITSVWLSVLVLDRYVGGAATYYLGSGVLAWGWLKANWGDCKCNRHPPHQL